MYALFYEMKLIEIKIKEQEMDHKRNLSRPENHLGWANKKRNIVESDTKMCFTLNTGTKWSVEALPRVLQLPAGRQQEE